MCNDCCKSDLNHDISSPEDLKKYKEYLERELAVTIKALKDIKEEYEKK